MTSGNWGYAGGNDEDQSYTQSWDTGLHYHSGIYSSQLIANYQRIKDYNYSSDAGRYAAGTTPMIWNSAISSGEIMLW